MAKGQQGVPGRTAGGASVVALARDCRDCSRRSRSEAVKCVFAIGRRHGHLFPQVCVAPRFDVWFRLPAEKNTPMVLNGKL